MIKLPQREIFNESNKGDKFGDIWSSYNLDLTGKLGSLRLTPRMLLNLNNVTDSNLGVPCAAKFFTAGGFTFWAICGAYVYHSASSSGLNTAFVKDAIASSPTDCDPEQSDMEVFNNTLYVTRNNTSISKLSSGGAWSSVSNALANASGIHQLSFLRSQNRLYYIDGNNSGISSLSTADVIVLYNSNNQYSLNLVAGSVGSTGASISWIKANSQYIFIGTIDSTGDFGKVYYWDGSQASGPNGFFTLEANGSLACTIENDVPFIVDTKGRLLKLNGGTFTEVDRLPYGNNPPVTYFQTPTAHIVHYNGIDSINGRVNILVNGTLGSLGNYNQENLASGIWEYTQETGLHHKTSLGISTSAGTITDYGQQKLLRVGCLASLDCPVSATYNGTFLAGATYYSDATTQVKGLFYDDTNDTLQKAGYIVSPKIFSQNIQDSFNEIIPRFEKFLNSTDKMVLKHRTSDVASNEFTITWSNYGTIFQTTQTGLVVGDEIEILQGIGSGVCAHITSIETSGSTYFVTIDETVVGISTGTTAIARSQKWIKSASYNSQTENFYRFSLRTRNTGPWVQFKIWFKWTGNNEVYDIIINNTKQQ